jgi:hypothetical protein
MLGDGDTGRPGVGAGVGVGAGELVGKEQPAPQPRLETLVPKAPILSRVQLQLFVALRSTKYPNGSTDNLSRYSPAGSPVTSIDW